MEKKPTYIGKIKKGGGQFVKAPLETETRTGDKKITGTDLRSGKAGNRK